MDSGLEGVPGNRRMRILVIVAASAIMATWLPNPAQTQSIQDVSLLRAREHQRLNEEARKAYEAGITALDHIDAITAIDRLAEASQLAPEAVNLHFLTARVAQLRGRMVFGSEAQEYYDIAREVLEQIGKQKALTPLEKERHARQMNEVAAERSQLAVRDQRREATGRTLRGLIDKERAGPEEEKGGKRARVAVKRALRVHGPRGGGPRRGRRVEMPDGQRGGPGGMFGGQSGGGFPPEGGPFGGQPGGGPFGGGPPRR
ncbi:hypothetical protein AMJ85_07305 [candidate division BRC1 bacterium SM23_51]|nr:MAG: hypothetical protein AMJ85_07305 [candidate division BRC1 bacterium SM23_51]